MAETKTPKKYFAEGKWTFENFRYAARQIRKPDEGYLDSQLPVMEEMADKANEIINKEKECLKEKYK